MILYQEYDVTDILKKNSVIEIGVGQGWAVGYITRFFVFITFYIDNLAEELLRCKIKFLV